MYEYRSNVTLELPQFYMNDTLYIKEKIDEFVKEQVVTALCAAPVIHKNNTWWFRNFTSANKFIITSRHMYSGRDYMHVRRTTKTPQEWGRKIECFMYDKDDVKLLVEKIQRSDTVECYVTIKIPYSSRIWRVEN